MGYKSKNPISKTSLHRKVAAPKNYLYQLFHFKTGLVVDTTWITQTLLQGFRIIISCYQLKLCTSSALVYCQEHLQNSTSEHSMMRPTQKKKLNQCI